MPLLRRVRLLLALLLCSAGAAAQSPSPTAQSVYTQVRPSLVQLQTLVVAAGRQASTGSGFVVGAGGLAITNYHVVSQHALEPETYRLEYTAADGERGTLTLLAIDVANDLAVVRLSRPDMPALGFDRRAVAGSLTKGERLYGMGNPLNLGFTIVEGTYNGLVERSYNERIHFTGAINAGMSGGPTVTADGQVAGINVSKQYGGDLVSFLVPAKFAARLLESARERAPPAPGTLKAEVGRQLVAWQGELYRAMGEAGFRAAPYGPYGAPESAAPWFTCWSQTNASQVPKPRASMNTTTCRSETRLFIASDLSTGAVQVSHTHLRSAGLNPFQFGAFLGQQTRYYGYEFAGTNRRWQTRPQCREELVAVEPKADHPPLQVRWCARAYRPFDGLYDIWLAVTTRDQANEALVSRLSMQGIDFDTGVALSRRFIAALQWAK